MLDHPYGPLLKRHELNPAVFKSSACQTIAADSLDLIGADEDIATRVAGLQISSSRCTAGFPVSLIWILAH
jgi:hypothetical protein